MAELRTLEAQGENGNGCGKDFADLVESIFCNFGAALNEIAVEVRTEALAGVSERIKALIPPEQAFAFAKAVTAREVTNTFWDELNRGPQSPLTPKLLVAVSSARNNTLKLLNSFYSAGNEQGLSSLAAAIREQIRQGRYNP